MPSDERPTLRLLDALVRWSDPGLVEKVREAERQLIPYELHQVQRPKLAPEHEWRKPTKDSWKIPTDFTFITAAWRSLEHDFARRIELEEIYLAGVPSDEVSATEHVPIPAVWAADLVFDFERNILSRKGRHYTAIRASQHPFPAPSAPVQHEAATPQASQPELGPITPETVPNLSDEEVLLLLEEHARRVIAKDELKALDPGITKVSFMPLILRKMRARAEAGELRGSLTKEAAELETWIHDKAPSHQTPTAPAIENALRDEYRRLKAQSPGKIP